MNQPPLPQRCDGVIPGVYTRRQMLKTLTTGFGYMAFSGLATQAALAEGLGADPAAGAAYEPIPPPLEHDEAEDQRGLYDEA